MLKVDRIIKIEPYNIVCLFNNGIEKSINVFPIIENHKHLKGIEKLKDENIFCSAKIGVFGEILWENIIYNAKDSDWLDYDMSPEFIFYDCK
jgi:Protein of unknown function (DUF2442)